MNDEKNPYADIIRLPHHQSLKRPWMSMLNRAAQFSPYAALAGFDGVIAETGRLTDRRAELSESEKIRMDRKLALIGGALREGRHPTVTVKYFVKDAFKEGGSYEEYTGQVRRIDAAGRTVEFLTAGGRPGGKVIPVDDLSDIRGGETDAYEEDDQA